MNDIQVTFVYKDGTRVETQNQVGSSILDIARKYNIPIKGSCDGNLACSTCHVYTDARYPQLLHSISEEENDILDKAFHIEYNSRLCCQIFLTEEMNGMCIYLVE